MVINMVNKNKDKSGKFVKKEVVTEESSVKAVENKYERRVRPFIFSDDEITDMPDRVRTIVETKRDMHYKVEGAKRLSRGPDFLTWKLIVAVKVAQKHPFIVKYLGNNGCHCKLCGVVTAWAANCAWDDRYWIREERKMGTRKFIISQVCSDCLEMVNAKFLKFPEYVDVILSNRDKIQFNSLGNAKSFACELCSEHNSDSTWIHVPWKKLLLNVAVCEKHFDALVTPNMVTTKISIDAIEIAEEMVKQNLLSQGTLSMMQLYRRKTTQEL